MATTPNAPGDRPAAADPPPSVLPVDGEMLLRVEDLRTHIRLGRGVVKAVDGVSFTIRRGETVGLVGESGSGKTMTLMSIMRLLPVAAARIVGGHIWFGGRDLLGEPEGAMRQIRGARIALIMQDALTALNPVLTVGDQVTEPLRYHPGRHAGTPRERAVEVMRAVRIAAPERRLDEYPHQFSGGMRQRSLAAMALGPSPDLILADEPTTALDVTIQAQFLTLIRRLQRDTGTSALWVTHDLGVVAQTCDRVNVMYAGRIVESGDVRRMLRQPRHPYTVALMESVPKLGEKRDRLYQIQGQPPDLTKLSTGCPFYDRCPLRMDICRDAFPPATALDDGGYVHCWAVGDGSAAGGASPAAVEPGP
jgi:peptide/nickel transport system ATP-binding protein